MIGTLYIKFSTFQHNTTPNSVFENKYTPFELVFGKSATVPNETKTNLDPVNNVQNYSKEMKYRLQKTISARQLINRHK